MISHRNHTLAKLRQFGFTILCKTLGNRMHSLREQKGVSQESFADICGLHRTAVGLLERGKSIPRLDTLLIISEHLGVTVSDLLEGLKH
jgi:transcriptional regulator with XRE-family HTH domain